MIKVIVADDHPILRSGLLRLINTSDDIRVIDEASTSEELVKMVQYENYDVVIMDLIMPDKGGIWALTKIKELMPEIKIIILSAADDKSSVVSAFKLGADGYVSKQSDMKELIEAIHTVHDQQIRFISPIIYNELKDVIDTDSNVNTERLSKRELQTLALAGEGKSLTEISEILDLSIKTVSTYKSRIFDKLGCKNSHELIRFAIDNNIKSSYFLDDDI